MTKKTYETYMDSRNNLGAAIEQYVAVSYTVDLTEEMIASNIADVIHDYNKKLYETLQKQMLPMVKEFNGSKSMKHDEIVKDWELLIVKWDQDQMWKKLSS